MSCHFVSWCRGLVLAFKDIDITINKQTYYGTLHDLCTTIKRKHDVAWQCLSQYGLLCPGHGALHTLAAGPTPIEFGAMSVIVLSQTNTSTPQWYSSSRNSFLRRGSIGWCVNRMPASMLMGTIFTSLYFFAQNNPRMGFIWTDFL
jgi:hypothetical protein